MSKKGIPSLIALILHGLGFLIYLILLYFTSFMAEVYLKSCVYVFISSIFLFLIIDEWNGTSDEKQRQFNLINKFIFVFNFLLSAFTIAKIIDGVWLMGAYCLSIAITSIFILISGTKHGLFQDEN